MAQAGVLSFIGVGLLYIAGFGCVRHPAMALTCLLVPMGWSFGYILLTVGHLNILSSAFATIVIGLGSDYGVYHIAQYLRLSRREDVHLRGPDGNGPQRRPRPDDQRRGHRLGLLHHRPERFSRHRRVGHYRRRRHPLVLAGGADDAARADPLVRRPSRVLAGAGAAGCLCLAPSVGKPAAARRGGLCGLHRLLVCTRAKDLWYDHNLLNLQAKGLESVELEKTLLHERLRASFAIVMAKSREEVVPRKAMYADRKLCPMVDSVDEIATYVPVDVTQKRPMIQRIHDRLADARN